MNTEKENKNKIDGGFTAWARKTLESEIFRNKPANWFKIWFYIVQKMSYKTNKINGVLYEKGEKFLKYAWIMEACRVTPDEVKHCVAWLKSPFYREGGRIQKSAPMIATRRAIGGFYVKVLTYDKYQDKNNYIFKEKPQEKPLVQELRSQAKATTYINNNNNTNKNIYIFDFEKIFSEFKSRIFENAKMENLEKEKILERLKKYSENELLQAILNFSKSDWWMKNNNFRGISWFFQSDERVEQFINLTNNSENEDNRERINSFFNKFNENKRNDK